MTLREFLPPVLAATFDRIAKSFAATPADFVKGNDVGLAQLNRLVAPYEQSAWVFAAINLVSGEFTGLPVKFYSGDLEFEDAALAAWWTAPALGNDGKRLSRSAVDQLLALYAQLHGEFFILLDDSWVVTAGRKPGSFTPFIVARPDRIQLIVQGGKLVGYRYTDPAGRQMTLVPEQVIHHMEPNPYDDWRGISRADVARVATEGAFLTGTYIRDLMRNNGDQGFIVVGKSGPAVDGQKEQIVADLKAKRAALRRGVAMDLFLTGDITVDRPTEQAAGVDLTNTNTLSHQEIFITFGVPPSMSTVKQAYSIGKESDRYQLITGRSQPLARDIAGGYAELASRQTGKALTAEHDWDEHPVMQEVRRARIEAGLKLWGAGMAWKDVNDFLDLGMTPFNGWEIAYLPFSVSPVEGSSAPEQDPALTEPPVKSLSLVPEIAQLKLILATRSRAAKAKDVTPLPDREIEIDVLRAFTCGCDAIRTPLQAKAYTVQKADRDPKEIALWKQHMAGRREQVKGFESRFRSSLFKARAETLRNIQRDYKPAEKSALNSQLSTKATAADLLFDLADFAADFTAGMRKQHKLALDAAGKQVQKELGKDDPFEFAADSVKDFIDGRANKLSGVPDDVWGRIQETLKAGYDAGDTTDELSARVRAEFNAIDKGRSQVIAQTETASAFGYGRNAAMEDAGVEYKAWLTSGNSNVRTAHQEAGLSYPQDGGIPLDEPFIVDGEELMYPGDESGSPGNTINCHCVQIAVRAPADL